LAPKKESWEQEEKHYVRLTIFGIQLNSVTSWQPVGSQLAASWQPVGTVTTSAASSAVLGSFFADHQKGDGLLPARMGPIAWSSNNTPIAWDA